MLVYIHTWILWVIMLVNLLNILLGCEWVVKGLLTLSLPPWNGQQRRKKQPASTSGDQVAVICKYLVCGVLGTFLTFSHHLANVMLMSSPFFVIHLSVRSTRM